MKSRSLKMPVLAASFLATSLLAFAGGQPRTYTPAKDEVHDREGIGRNINQGKGAGMTRSYAVLRGNAYRSQTAEDTKAIKEESKAARPNWNDSAFHK
jgi:hypothetical protein